MGDLLEQDDHVPLKEENKENTGRADPITVYTHTKNPFIPKVKRIFVDFDKKKSSDLGISQTTAGLLSVVIGALGLYLQGLVGNCNPACYNYVLYSGYGMWCSVFSIIVGAIASRAATMKTLVLLRALLGLSVISLFFSLVSWIFSVVVLSQIHTVHTYRKYVVAVGCLLLLCATAQIVTSIWLCKLAGEHLCYKKVPTITTPVPEVQYINVRNDDGSFSQKYVKVRNAENVQSNVWNPSNSSNAHAKASDQSQNQSSSQRFVVLSNIQVESPNSGTPETSLGEKFLTESTVPSAGLPPSYDSSTSDGGKQENEVL